MGQRRDYSAVAVVERGRRGECTFDAVRWDWPEEAAADEWVVRRSERMLRGPPYTAVTARIVELAPNPKLRGDRQLVMYATGVGGRWLDMLRAAQPGAGSRRWIRGRQGERFDRKIWHVPKLETQRRGEEGNEIGPLPRGACCAGPWETIVRDVEDS